MWRAGLVLFVTLAGCSRSDAGSQTSTSTTNLTSAELSSSSVTFLEPDPLLTRRVESAIAADPLLSVNARNVDVSVDNGIVTLQGSVADKNFRRDVERAISEVPGVLATRNQIDVSMTRDTNDRESDDRIAFALQRSLTSLPSLRDGAELVSIEVVHGHVVLRGSTDSVEARERIKDLVAGTPGVNAITNEVTIRP